MSSDIVVCVRLFSHGDVLWGSTMAAFISVPAVIMNIFSFIWHYNDKSIKPVTVLVHFLLLAQVKRFCNIIFLVSFFISKYILRFLVLLFFTMYNFNMLHASCMYPLFFIIFINVFIISIMILPMYKSFTNLEMLTLLLLFWPFKNVFVLLWHNTIYWFARNLGFLRDFKIAIIIKKI